MPWLVFGLVTAALSTLLVRALVLEEVHKDYVTTARAKGAGEGLVVRGHVLRNVVSPVVTAAGLNLAIAFAGVVFVETAFGLPGLGGMLRRSILQHDVPTTVGIVLFVTVAIMLVNLVFDLVCAAIDPRVRLGAVPTAR
jgi:peptide/nickel transport system permease protein